VSLKDRLQEELTAAMRSGDSLRRDTLRMAQSAAYSLEKRNRRPLTDDEVLGVLAREVKTRRESVEAFRAGHREDLASKEEAEIGILSEFLPQPLSEAELRDLVSSAIAETGASSARDLGRVMGVLSSRTRGRADGRRVSELVAQALAAADLERHEPGHAQAEPASSGGRAPGGG
jgi:uncharacterized protein YqeY